MGGRFKPPLPGLKGLSPGVVSPVNASWLGVGYLATIPIISPDSQVLSLFIHDCGVRLCETFAFSVTTVVSFLNCILQNVTIFYPFSLR